MSDTGRFYLMVGDWAMQGAWWRCPRCWWRTCKLTVAMTTLTWAAHAADTQSAKMLDVADNVLAVGSGASLLSIMAIAFHAGQLANRIKSLEVRVAAGEENDASITALAKDQAALAATVEAIGGSIKGIHADLHDIRKYLMNQGKH